MTSDWLCEQHCDQSLMACVVVCITMCLVLVSCGCLCSLLSRWLLYPWYICVAICLALNSLADIRCGKHWSVTLIACRAYVVACLEFFWLALTCICPQFMYLPNWAAWHKSPVSLPKAVNNPALDAAFSGHISAPPLFLHQPGFQPSQWIILFTTAHCITYYMYVQTDIYYCPLYNILCIYIQTDIHYCPLYNILYIYISTNIYSSLPTV